MEETYVEQVQGASRWKREVVIGNNLVLQTKVLITVSEGHSMINFTFTSFFKNLILFWFSKFLHFYILLKYSNLTNWVLNFSNSPNQNGTLLILYSITVCRHLVQVAFFGLLRNVRGCLVDAAWWMRTSFPSIRHAGKSETKKDNKTICGSFIGNWKSRRRKTERRVLTLCFIGVWLTSCQCGRAVVCIFFLFFCFVFFEGNGHRALLRCLTQKG